MPDIHTPYNISLKPVLNFCDDFNPDIINYLGDVTNAESCNYRKEKEGIKKDVETVKEDFEILERVVLKPFKKAAPRKTKVNYFLGNHEEWFYKAMATDWKSQHKYGVEDNIDLKKYNMTIVPRKRSINYGYLYFMHDPHHKVNQLHAKKAALQYRKCLIYGHTHDIQSFMAHSPIDIDEKILCKSIGCLCQLNPDYMEDEPNKWVNAFSSAYIRSNGQFNEYTTIITNCKFTAPNGKQYR